MQIWFIRVAGVTSEMRNYDLPQVEGIDHRTGKRKWLGVWVAIQSVGS